MDKPLIESGTSSIQRPSCQIQSTRLSNQTQTSRFTIDITHHFFRSRLLSTRAQPGPSTGRVRQAHPHSHLILGPQVLAHHGAVQAVFSPTPRRTTIEPHPVVSLSLSLCVPTAVCGHSVELRLPGLGIRLHISQLWQTTHACLTGYLSRTQCQETTPVRLFAT